MNQLEEGQSCLLGDRHDLKDEKFDCSSIQLGNAILAFKANLGSNWQCEQNWTRSINDLYGALKSAGEKLRGPRRLRDVHDSYYSRNGNDHSSCVRSLWFNGQLELTYVAAIASLPFREFGNMAYRTLRIEEEDTVE